MQFCIFDSENNIIRISVVFISTSWIQTQYLIHLCYNSIFQLINGASSNTQKLLKYFNGTAIVAFSRIPFVSSASLFPNNLALHSKDLKLSLLAISALKLVASSLERKHILLFVSK